MLRVLVFLFSICCVLCIPNQDGVKLKFNEILIYSDLCKENIKISYMSKIENKLIPLELNVFKNEIENFQFLLESQIYRINLPDEDYIAMFFEVKDIDGKTIYCYQADIMYVLENGEKKMHASYPFLEDGHLVSNYLSINFFVHEMEERYIYVISDTLEKKLNLDKSLEYAQLCTFSRDINLIQHESKKSLEICSCLRQDTPLSKKTENSLNSFQVLTLFYGYNLRSLFNLILKSYNSAKYEASILNEYILSPGELLYARLEGLFNNVEVECTLKKKFKNLNKHIEGTVFLDISNQLEESVNKIELLLLGLKKFLKKKFHVDNDYIKNRNNEYKRTFGSIINENVPTEIKVIRDRYESLHGCIYVRNLYDFFADFAIHYNPYHEFNDEYYQELEKLYLDASKKIEVFHTILVNIECLFSKNWITYYHKLINDDIFMTYNSERILNFLKKAKFYLTLVRRNKFYRYYVFNEVAFINKIIKEWEKINNQEKIQKL